MAITKLLVASSSQDLSWAWSANRGYPRCQESKTTGQKCKTKARRSAKTKMPLEDKVTSGRQSSRSVSARHCWLWREQRARVRSEMRCILAVLPVHQHSFLLSDTCVCQSNFFHLWDVPVPHSHLGEVSLTATLCCLPSFYMAERAA